MDLQEGECEGMDWIELAQDRDKWLAQDRERWLALVNAVMNLPVPYSAGSFLASWRTGQLLKKGSAPWS
jgi:hypothetical protein